MSGPLTTSCAILLSVEIDIASPDQNEFVLAGQNSRTLVHPER